MIDLRLSSRFLPEFALVTASVLWGASFLATKAGMEFAGPLGMVAMRFLVATAALAVCFPRVVRGITPTEWVGGTLVSVTALIAYAAQAYALQVIPTARVAFLSALYVPLVPVLQFAFFRQRASMGIWIGVALAVAGVGVMSGIVDTGLSLQQSDILSLGSAVAIAAEVVILGWFVRIANPLRIAFVMMAMTAALAASLAFAAGEPLPIASPTLVWIVLGFGVATAYVQFAMSWAQVRVDSSRAAIIYATEPVFGGLFGYAAGEMFGVSDVAGALIILAGVLVASLPRLALGWPLWQSLRRPEMHSPEPLV